jgi:uncharacterized protein DUF2382
VPVTREQVRPERKPINAATRSPTRTSPRPEHEVVLTEDRLVVNKQPCR